MREQKHKYKQHLIVANHHRDTTELHLLERLRVQFELGGLVKIKQSVGEQSQRCWSLGWS